MLIAVGFLKKLLVESLGCFSKMRTRTSPRRVPQLNIWQPDFGVLLWDERDPNSPV